MPGPLAGVKVIELGGIGPGPHAAMLLGDLGADVVRVDRPSGQTGSGPSGDQVLRNRRSLVLDLKDPAELEVLQSLIEKADVLIEGFRPGVMERLGLGPQPCAERNPRLVYGRMTGWGQDGPMAKVAGHDLNYLSMTGALWAMGSAADGPRPPLNLVGDYGGGSMLLLLGIVSALFERERSGRGQVVDAAMVDGVSLLAQMMWSMRGEGTWFDERANNILDSGAPFYDVYTAKDGGFLAVGAIEPQFYALLLDGLGLDPADLPHQDDKSQWPAMKLRFQDLFATRTRDEWAVVFEGTDACVTPVLDWQEAAAHPHMTARGTLPTYNGVVQAAPAPRFSRTPQDLPTPPRSPGEDRAFVLADWGVAP